MNESISQNFSHSIKKFIFKAGVKEPFELLPIHKGGNNRAWILKSGQKSYFLKQYFFSEYDKRDRFGNEIPFSMFAWEKGIRNIAKPIAADRKNLLGLFDYIEGIQLETKDINKCLLQQALKFIEELNQNKTSIKSQSLPCASESCFSLADHMDTVKKRIMRLKTMDIDDDITIEAKRFVVNELEPRWQEIQSDIEKKIAVNKLDPVEKISSDEMVISPSDFGFHNTILTKNNELFFIDFEYAGWDDPAKLICDFFCQPEIPVPFEYFNWFVKKTIEISGMEMSVKKTKLFQRTVLLIPLYRLKWCCIMLNDFIPIDQDRRKFSSYNADKRKVQLCKAVSTLRLSSCHKKQESDEKVLGCWFSALVHLCS